MLSLVTAAEHQYRHDVWTRDRELAVLASIRDRRDADHSNAPLVSAAAAVPRRAAWARPIGAPSAAECAQAACGVA